MPTKIERKLKKILSICDFDSNYSLTKIDKRDINANENLVSGFLLSADSFDIVIALINVALLNNKYDYVLAMSTQFTTINCSFNSDDVKDDDVAFMIYYSLDEMLDKSTCDRFYEQYFANHPKYLNDKDIVADAFMKYVDVMSDSKIVSTNQIHKA